MARPSKKLTPGASSAPVRPSGEVGISGTTNWRGDPLAESNSKLLYQAAYGQPGSRTWGEWEEISRTDPDIATVLDFVCAPLRDARVDVEPAEHPDIPPAVAQAQADFVRWSLLENAAPRWPEVIQQMVRGALVYGFALHEVVLGVVSHPTLPNGVGYGLRKLAGRLPSSVHTTNGWVEETDPTTGERDLAIIRQVGQKGDKWESSIELPADRVLLTTWNREGNNYRGFSAFRAVWYVAKIRQDVLRLVGIAVTREGAGVPVAVSQHENATLTPPQRKALSRLLSNLVFHENASIVMPSGWDLKWLYSSGADKTHVVNVYNELGILILRQLQAQQIALGTGSTGSRAVGEVHNQVAQGFIGGISATLEAVLNGTGGRAYTGLTRKLVEPNWGPQPAYPTIKLVPKRPQIEPLSKMQAIQAAVTAGVLTVTERDEAAVREELGLPLLEAGEREAAQAQAVAKAKALQPPAPMPVRPLAAMAAFTPSRPLRPSEQRLDLAAMDSFLNRARNDFERLARPAVVEMLVRAQPAIHEAMADGDPSDVATVPLDMSRVNEAIAKFIGAARAEGQRQVRAELAKGSGPKVAKKRAEGDQTLAPVRGLAAPPGEDPEDETDALAAAQAKALARRMEARLRQEMEREAIDAMRTNDDAGAVVARTVSRQLDTGAFRSDAGLVLTKAWNLGRDEAARMLGGVEQVELSAILDGKQCDPCGSLDGERFAFGSAEHDANVPPLRACEGGDNCRCMLVYLPATETESDE